MAYSNDLRRCVYKHIKDGGSQAEAVRLFGVDRKTIYNWLKAPSLERVQIKRARNRKINKDNLAAHVRQHPDALLKERAEIFHVSASGIWRALNRMNIVKKNDKISGKKSHKKTVVFARAA